MTSFEIGFLSWKLGSEPTVETVFSEMKSPILGGRFLLMLVIKSRGCQRTGVLTNRNISSCSLCTGEVGDLDIFRKYLHLTKLIRAI